MYDLISALVQQFDPPCLVQKPHFPPPDWLHTCSDCCAGEAEVFFDVKQFQRFETLLPKATRFLCRSRIARQGSCFIFGDHGLSGAYIDYFNRDFTEKSQALPSAGPNSPPIYFMRDEFYRKVQKGVSERLELNKVWP